MSSRESVTVRCPKCGRRFRVLADEEGQHECPSCGYGPDEYDPPPSEEEDDNQEEDKCPSTD